MIVAERSLLKWLSSCGATVSCDVDQVGQLHHLPVARRARRCWTGRSASRAVGVGDLHDHVVLLAVLLEARDLAPAEHASRACGRPSRRRCRGRPPCRGRPRRAARGLLSLRSVSRLVSRGFSAHLRHQLVDRRSAARPRARGLHDELHRLPTGSAPSDGGVIGKAMSRGCRRTAAAPGSPTTACWRA